VDKRLCIPDGVMWVPVPAACSVVCAVDGGPAIQLFMVQV